MIVMAVVVDMLVGMFTCLMAVLMAIVGMSHRLVLMLVLMFVFAMAAHIFSPPLNNLLEYNIPQSACQAGETFIGRVITPS